MKKQDLYIFIGMIIFLAIIFGVYLIASLFAPASKPETLPLPSATPIKSIKPFSSEGFIPSPQPTITPLPSLTPEAVKDRTLSSLPLVTPAFTIEYYYDGDIFRITIKQNPYAANKAKAEQWLKDQGLNPTSLNIFWDAYPEVQR